MGISKHIHVHDRRRPPPSLCFSLVPRVPTNEERKAAELFASFSSFASLFPALFCLWRARSAPSASVRRGQIENALASRDSCLGRWRAISQRRWKTDLNAKRRIMSVAQVCSINFGTVQEQAVLCQQSTPA